MRRRQIIFSILAIALFGVASAYNACTSNNTFSKVQGTVVTNPMAPVSNEILLAVCGVINRCNSQVTLESCQSGILNTSGFAAPLGLSSSVYSTFSTIVQSETQGQITGNATAASGCYDAINNSSCSDPTVQNAYDASLSNPFSNAPGVIPSANCNQVYTAGVNLEVPIELVDQGLTSNISTTLFSRTTTSLDTNDYDGTVTYSLEIVGNNTDSLSRNVSLINSSGSVVAVIPVANTGNASWQPTRFATSFSPSTTADNYRIQLDGTTTANELVVYEARIRVKQVGATQTKIFIPLTAGIAGAGTNSDLTNDDTTNLGTYSQPQSAWYSLWRKNNAAYSQLSAGSPWTFEAVLSDSSGTTYASLFDADTGLQVSASEVSTTSTTPTLVSQSFSDASTNFNDQDRMQVQIKENGGIGSIYRAGLWIKLNNLSHAEVLYRLSTFLQLNSGANAQDNTGSLALFSTGSYVSPTFYQQLVGSVGSAGTSCTVSLFDNGTNDVGFTGSAVSGSTLTLSSTAMTLQRSPALTLASGDRFSISSSANPGPGSCGIQSAFLVIGF